MNTIQNYTAQLRADFIENATEFGFSPQEIAAATGDCNGDDYFMREAEAKVRRALAVKRTYKHLGIRAASQRQPVVRRALRRQAKTKATIGTYQVIPAESGWCRVLAQICYDCRYEVTHEAPVIGWCDGQPVYPEVVERNVNLRDCLSFGADRALVKPDGSVIADSGINYSSITCWLRHLDAIVEMEACDDLI